MEILTGILIYKTWYFKFQVTTILFIMFCLLQSGICRWYRPENHHSELVDWMTRRQQISQGVWDCIDVFGASGKVAQVWKDHGYSAIGYDIKLTRQHDICTQRGFKCLLSMGLGKL